MRKARLKFYQLILFLIAFSIPLSEHVPLAPRNVLSWKCRPKLKEREMCTCVWYCLLSRYIFSLMCGLPFSPLCLFIINANHLEQ